MPLQSSQCDCRLFVGQHVKFHKGFFTYTRHHIPSPDGTTSAAQVTNILLVTGKKTLLKITFRILKKKSVPSQLNPHSPTWCVHELQDKCIDQHGVPWWLSLHSVIFKYNLNPIHFVYYLKIIYKYIIIIIIYNKYNNLAVIFIMYLRNTTNVYWYKIGFLIFLVYLVSVYI